ncbi:MAG: alcohol dehydrogenase catalytic domain-containing protein [Anaerolineaceae bacterium]
MKQAVMIAPGQIEFREIERPKPLPQEILIEVKRIGICGSDIHVYHGLHPYTSYPIVQGHEVSGVIAEIGGGVTGFGKGEQVVFMPQIFCGTCYSCRNHMEHICDQLKVMGFQVNGAAQEYFSIPAGKVLKAPANITLDQAAMIEPLSVAIHALSRFGDVGGKNVIVLGAGTIGNLVAQVARSLGASKVLITDISEFKLALARACGISLTVNSNRVNLGDELMKAFGPDKADVILECVGSQDTISQAIEHARKGSVIVVVGVFGKKPCIDLGLVQDRELTITGTLMYQKKDYECAVQLISQGLLNLDTMITHRFPFSDYPQAYREIEELGGDYLKVMIEMQ